MLKQIVTGVSAKYLTLFRKITLLHSLVFRKYASSSVRCVTLGRVFCLSQRALFFSCTEYLRMLIQLVKLLDEDLHEHLKQEVSIWLALSFTHKMPTCPCSHNLLLLQPQGIDFLQFGFRWINCLMLREIPFHLFPRLWVRLAFISSV